LNFVVRRLHSRHVNVQPGGRREWHLFPCTQVNEEAEAMALRLEAGAAEAERRAAAASEAGCKAASEAEAEAVAAREAAEAAAVAARRARPWDSFL
jgi:hypothetical protein